MISLISTATLVIVDLVSASNRQAGFPMGGSGKVIQINSATDFCTFLPPLPSVTIVDSEGYPTTDPVLSAPFAVAFCTNPSTGPAGSKPIYDGLITGVSYHKEASFVSVSGTLDPTKAGLKIDGGGYYDLDSNVNSPPGGICQGYDSFYNQINPVDGIWCVKCCELIWPRLLKGMVPGSYTAGVFDGGALPVTGVSVVNGKVVTGTSTPSTGATTSSGSGSGTSATGSSKNGAAQSGFIDGVAGLITALTALVL